MIENNFDELLRKEEEKRNKQLDPAIRWHLLQDAITWAEQFAPQNTPEAQRNHEKKLLAG